MTNHINLLLLEPTAAVPVDFSPDDMGVVVDVGSRRYHPEFRLFSDLAQRAEIGWPQFWAYDGSQIHFDVSAPSGVRIEASTHLIRIES
jgi:hypothetical protein